MQALGNIIRRHAIHFFENNEDNSTHLPDGAVTALISKAQLIRPFGRLFTETTGGQRSGKQGEMDSVQSNWGNVAQWES